MAMIMRWLGLNPDQQKALFRLRGKLMLRSFSREKGKIIGFVMAVIFLLPMFVGMAVGTYFGYTATPNQWPIQILGMVLVLLWLSWLFLPILVLNLSDGGDITRLLTYPISRRDLTASLIFGTLFDYPTYFMLPFFAAIIVAWALTPAIPIVLLGLLITYGHMMLGSQLVLAAFGGILKSRRLRDLMVLLTIVFFSSCGFMNIIMSRFIAFMEAAETSGDLERFDILPLLQWSPPGATARAIQFAEIGEWGRGLLWLGYSALWLVIIGVVWSRLMGRLATGGGFVFNLPEKEEKVRTVSSGNRLGKVLGWLPFQLRTFVEKELRLIWRVPIRRTSLIQGFLMPLVFLAISIGLGNDLEVSEVPSSVTRFLPLILVGYGWFIFWATTLNMLAWDGDGIGRLLLSPYPRRNIFLGKGIALLITNLFPILIYLLVLSSVQNNWQLMIAFPVIVGVGLATMMITAVFSVHFPYPVKLEGNPFKSSSGFTKGGIVPAIMHIFILPLATLIAAVPAVALFAFAIWQNTLWFMLLAGVVAVVYGAIAFWIGTGIASKDLVRREPEVIKATVPLKES